MITPDETIDGGPRRMMRARDEALRYNVWRQWIHKGTSNDLGIWERMSYLVLRNEQISYKVMISCEIIDGKVVGGMLYYSIVNRKTFDNSVSTYVRTYISDFRILISHDLMRLVILESNDLYLLNKFINMYEKRFNIVFPRLFGSVNLPQFGRREYYPYDTI